MPRIVPPTFACLLQGIPTYLYGHEPPNVFCAAQAKFFSNAVREDVLVLTCNSGIVFCPGSAGTRTEIAQFAVPPVGAIASATAMVLTPVCNQQLPVTSANENGKQASCY